MSEGGGHIPGGPRVPGCRDLSPSFLACFHPVFGRVASEDQLTPSSLSLPGPRGAWAVCSCAKQNLSQSPGTSWMPLPLPAQDRACVQESRVELAVARTGSLPVTPSCPADEVLASARDGNLRPRRGVCETYILIGAGKNPFRAFFILTPGCQGTVFGSLLLIGRSTVPHVRMSL